MQQTVPPTQFDRSYAEGDPPWVIGTAQPVVDELERAGWFSGAVLDAGCGTGEHTILLADRGYDVLGIDSSRNALQRARANAAAQGVPARFELADALRPPWQQRFDTVVDSALFHVFGPDDQRAYARALHQVCRPDAVLHVLALADVETGFGPRVGADEIRAAFVDGWELESLELSRYQGIARGPAAEGLDVAEGERIDATAHLARARRR